MSAPASLLAGAAWLPALAALAAKATVILLLAAFAAALLRRSSAAVRHLVWLAGMGGVLLLPLAAAVSPAWELRVLPAPGAPAESLAAPPPDVPAPSVALAVGAPPSERVEPAGRSAGAWITGAMGAIVVAGVLAGLLRMAIGWLGVLRLGRASVAVADPGWLRMQKETAARLRLDRRVRLLRARAPVMPATWGVFRPAVILPLTADMWPGDRRQAVLAHELAHVKRYDCLTQAVAQLACALYWWHPLVWYAARRLGVERERACDDLVLATGTRASSYATHLLEIASSHRSVWLSGPTLVGMARPSHLASRLAWVLDASLDRRVPTARVSALAALATLLVVAPLAAARPTAAPAQPAPAAAPVAPARPQTPPAPAPRPRAPEAPAPAPAPAPAAAPEAPAPAPAPVPPRAPAVRPAPAPRPAAAVRPGPTPRPVPALPADTPHLGGLPSRGPDGPTPEELVRLRAVGVTPAYVAGMNREGFVRLSVDEWVALRAMGVTPGYVREMRSLTLADDTDGPRDLVAMRIHGVRAEGIRELRELGNADLTPRQLVEMRVHRVTPAFIRELREAGLADLTPEALVRMRVHGVDAAFVRGARRDGPG
jgi:beta-lactamase regulating signal transducer with metallopeptidase domain